MLNRCSQTTAERHERSLEGDQGRRELPPASSRNQSDTARQSRTAALAAGAATPAVETTSAISATSIPADPPETDATAASTAVGMIASRRAGEIGDPTATNAAQGATTLHA